MNTNKENNTINHPRHYNRDGAIECIDEMELIFGTEFVMHFCLANVFKYRYRSGLKDDGYEDLKKSDWYMAKYKELKAKCELLNYNVPSVTIPYRGFNDDQNILTSPIITCNNVQTAQVNASEIK